MINLDKCPRKGDTYYYVDEINLEIREFTITNVVVQNSTEYTIEEKENLIRKNESRIYAESDRCNNFMWFDYDERYDKYTCQDNHSYLTLEEAKEFFKYILNCKLKQKTTSFNLLEKQIKDINNKLNNL